MVFIHCCWMLLAKFESKRKLQMNWWARKREFLYSTVPHRPKWHTCCMINDVQYAEFQWKKISLEGSKTPYNKKEKTKKKKAVFLHIVSLISWINRRRFFSLVLSKLNAFNKCQVGDVVWTIMDWNEDFCSNFCTNR